MRKFTKSERGTFLYWICHWYAYNLTSLRLRCWHPHHLLHDIEKPFLMLLWHKDYPRVQKWHRQHNGHHLECRRTKTEQDWIDMLIDWECSRLTKVSSPRTALQEATFMLKNGAIDQQTFDKLLSAAVSIGLKS